jgi:hypothetical protein
VDQICRSAGTVNHWLSQFAAACRQIKLSRLATFRRKRHVFDEQRKDLAARHRPTRAVGL